jgi:hypothetical protein
MKRVQLGTKRKKASPARKPVAKPSKLRKKSVPAKTPAKKSAPARKAKAKTAKAKVAKRKVVRAKVTKTRSAKPKRAVVSKRQPAQPVAKASIAVPAKAAEPAVTFAIGADEELAVPATVLVETRAANRKPARKSAPKSKRTVATTPPLTVPAFLLEGDEPGHPDVGGPGEKFSLGPTTPLEHLSEAIAPLPDSYGTGKLFLTARDPHWLYAHWDLPREEQFRHNARSLDRHLILRVFAAAAPESPTSEIHVHPESKHWFIHVEQAGAAYTTELGYYQAGRKWKSLSTSTPQRTPPDNISKDATVKFATIPAELSFETMLALLKETAGEAAQNTPLAHAVDRIRPRAREYFPGGAAPGDWTVEQEQALGNVLAADRAGVALLSSDEFVPPEAEVSWPEFAFNFGTGETAPLPSPTSYVSSFFGGETPKDFWFNINAELIIYGATEPNATVTFAGKQITLRPDGSFRFRFALPDGQFELPVTAVSADGTDGRAAELKFTRHTEVRGHVTAAPVDPALNPPPAS